MIKLLPLSGDVMKIYEYIKDCPNFCDLSIGVKYIWRDEFRIDYAIYNDTLILRESCKDYDNAFYFPIGNDELGALLEIENYCQENRQPLKFCLLTEEQKTFLANRYEDTKEYFIRDWSDYIYEAESLKNLVGKKYNGQRNHINKFKKLYSNYQVSEIKEEDLPLIAEFLILFERGTDFSVWSEREEEKKVFDYIKKCFFFNQAGANMLGAKIIVDGKVVAISVGEIRGDTIYIHVEKALKEYAGVYPMMSNAFLKMFCTDEVKFVNREEDCGDLGLRTSKMQYHPIEIKNKYIVDVFTAFYRANKLINISVDELTITNYKKEDMGEYLKLATDDELNKLWGYDFREDLKGSEPNEEYFYSFITGLIEKGEEVPLAVKLGDKLIGELTIYSFGYYNDCEIGYRFLREYQRKGYARKSASALIDYAYNRLGIKTIKSNCFKENERSKNLIEKLGFVYREEDEKKLYFTHKNKNTY